MKHLKVLSWIPAALGLLCGCATGYNHSGLFGGFSDTQLAPDVFRVTFKGNGYTSRERTADFALLRAAELCQTNGFPFFAVVTGQSGGTASSYTTPSTAYTTGSGSYQGVATGNTISGSYSYAGTTTYNPGQTFTWFKPETGLLVQGFKEKPDGIYTFDSTFLVKSIKDRYNIKQR